MPIELNLESGDKVVDIYVSGKLTKADYEHSLPKLERLIAVNGKLSALFDVTDLKGLDAGALWEEVKFDVKHMSDFERIAVIGDQKWEEVMTSICKPFTRATLRFFDEDDVAHARKWLNSPTVLRSTNRITKPEVALVALTRFALGVGVGLIAAPRMCRKTRNAVGWTLVALGVATTAPLLVEIFGAQTRPSNEIGE